LIEVACDASGLQTDREIAALVAATLEEFGPSDYVRVRVGGSVPPQTRVDCEELAATYGTGLGSLEIFDTTIAHDYEAIAREPTVRGHVVRDLLALGDEGSDALRYALAAFDATEIAP
jgi:hypothetical protein